MKNIVLHLFTWVILFVNSPAIAEKIDFIIDSNREIPVILNVIIDGKPTIRYVYPPDEPNPIIRYNTITGIQHFFHYDGQQNLRTVTDSTGQVIAEFDYDAFGNLLDFRGDENLKSEQRFGSHQFDAALQQYYARARQYNPNIGRFTQMDQWPGKINNPITLNKYLYAHADPVNQYDPSGKFTIGSMLSSVNVASNLYTAGSIGVDLLAGNYGGAGWQIAAEVVQSKLGRYGRLAKLSSEQFKLFANVWTKGVKLTLGKPANSRILGKNMEAIFGSRPLGHEAHHLIGKTSEFGQKSRDKLKNFGIDVNSPSNGVFLPGKNCSIGIGSTHCGKHTTAYERYVWNRLREVETKEQMINTLSDIRNQLLSGTLKLNKRS